MTSLGRPQQALLLDAFGRANDALDQQSASGMEALLESAATPVASKIWPERATVLGKWTSVPRIVLPWLSGHGKILHVATLTAEAGSGAGSGGALAVAFNLLR